MTADEIADLVVDQVKTVEAPVIVFTARKPADVAEASAEQRGWTVFVLPFEEREAPFDQGYASKRERVVSIVVNGPVGGTADRAKGMELAEQVRLVLEGVELGGYLWSGNEVVSLYDAEALKTKNQFLSLARATYFDLS